MYPPDWPPALRQEIENRLGLPEAVEPLAGVARTTTFRIRGPRGSVIVKRSDRPTESRFYEQAAPQLAERGIPVPHLEWSCQANGTYWIVLEDVPHPLPRDRWLADPELLAVLRRLHALDLDLPLPAPDRYVPAWPDEMTDAALTRFPAGIARTISHPLAAFQAACRPLFAPIGLISGDPNPTNWGLRGDGTLVLFDWERVTRSHPALDLAITVPGLGRVADFRLVAARYVAAGDRDGRSLTAGDLAAAIAVAKVWSVVEFLDVTARDRIGGDAPNHPSLDRLIAAFPDWLASLPHPR